jgi:hypothetical protein
MKKYKLKDKMCAFYIDLKSAYNTIDRIKLFNMIRRRNILQSKECDFLE